VRDPFSLFRPESYLVQLQRLRAKARERGRTGQSDGESLVLAQPSGADVELCSLLASDVRRETFVLEPLRRTEVSVDGKRRTIHRPALLDALVLGAVSARLTSLLEQTLSDSVHAYRPGRSSQRVVERLRQTLARHREQRRPKERGLFVLQRDLATYGESIPTGRESLLWSLSNGLLQKVSDPDERRVLYALLRAACRPQVLLPDGQVVAMERGLPTGSPIQQPLENLYLAPLDEALDQLPVFYARFGDDLFVATPSAEQAKNAATQLETLVASLELSFNPDKTKNLYFTKPGRPFGATSDLLVEPTSHVEYLGMRVDFDGRVGFTRKRLRQLLQRSRRRIDNSARVAPPERERETVARSLDQALCGTSTVADPALEALRTWVDDRTQLRQLDRQLALACAERLSGKRGVRAFRHTTISELRAAGLSSLLELRRRTRSRP
jgi:hypothetical protein